jgi:hypothetical protein
MKIEIVPLDYFCLSFRPRPNDRGDFRADCFSYHSGRWGLRQNLDEISRSFVSVQSMAFLVRRVHQNYRGY